MSIYIKPNQPLGNSVNACACPGDYCQPIETDDTTILQGYVTPGSGVNLVSDGEFDASSNWSLDTGWTISGGKLHATNIGGGSTADSVLPLGLTPGKLYLIQCEVDVTSAGSAGANQGFIIKVNNQALTLPGGVTAYNQDLTATWLFKPGTITTDMVQFSTNESTIDFDVLYIRIYEMSEVGLALYDNSGATQIDLTAFSSPNSLKYYFNGGQMTSGSIINEGEYSFNDYLVMFELIISTWASITSYTGCCTVRIYDTLLLVQRVRNGSFTGNANYWTLGASWEYASNAANYKTGFYMLEQTLSLTGGVSYTLQFAITFLGLGNYMALYINDTFTQAFSGNGTHTYTIDLTEYTGLVSIKLGFTGSVLGDHIYTIDNVSVVATGADTLNETGCINLREEHECTLLFGAYNYDDAFGFDYTTGAYRMFLRLEAKKDISAFPEEKEDYLFSDNSRALLFARSETEYEVLTADAPDYIHECLRVMRLHDVFTIDTALVIASGNYDLKRRKTSKLKQAAFTVKDAEGIASNYSCT